MTDGNDGTSNDHADWAEAKIIIPEGGTKPVALPPYEQFSVQTKEFTLSFVVGETGRLYQQPIGTTNSALPPLRDDEAYPQAGDGYIWEPALQVVHADGNTSTALIFEDVTRTNDGSGRELTRIRLRDSAYPLEVALNFRCDPQRDAVVEQWTEIMHHESGAG